MNQDPLEDLNFHAWWSKYKEGHDAHNCVPLETGGREWMAAFSAWQYSEILTKQRLSKT